MSTTSSTIASLEDQDDVYFLNLIKNHPNLYHQGHEFHNDSVMKKGSWGQIALSMAITIDEAKEKWEKLYAFYEEEAALRQCESGMGVADAGSALSSQNQLFDTMHSLLGSTAQEPEPSEKKIKCPKAATKSVYKKRVTKLANKAKGIAHRTSQNMTKVVAELEADPNAKIGKLVMIELQRRSRKSSARKRRQVFECIAAKCET